ARNRARTLAQHAYGEFAGVVHSLIAVSETVVADLHKEAVTAETEFFAGFGLDREATGVVHAIERLAETLKGFRGQLNNATVAALVTKQSLQPVLVWFK